MSSLLPSFAFSIVYCLLGALKVHWGLNTANSHINMPNEFLLLEAVDRSKFGSSEGGLFVVSCCPHPLHLFSSSPAFTCALSPSMLFFPPRQSCVLFMHQLIGWDCCFDLGTGDRV